MGRTRAWVALAAALLSLVACGGGGGGAAPSSPASSTTDSPTTAGAATAVTASAAPPYAARHFVPHLTVAPPPWLPAQPVLDERHFLTWVGEGADVDRA